jgi:hypothetical protein
VAAYLVAVVLYVLIAVVAVAPSIVADVGRLGAARQGGPAHPFVVFLGANVAWLLLFDQTQSHALA